MRSGDLLFRLGSLPRLSVLWLISGEGPWAREGRSPAQVGRAEPMGLRVEREGSRGPSGPGSGPWSIGSFRSVDLPVLPVHGPGPSCGECVP